MVQNALRKPKMNKHRRHDRDKLMKPIKFGVWGLGRIGVVHCRHFSQTQEMYELAAVCDQEMQRVDKVVEEHNCAGYRGAVEFLGDQNIELVIIATRSIDHATHAEQALAAGKLVLLEKPIAVTDGDLQKLRKIDKEYPGKLFFGHNHRFEPAIQQIRGIVASGVLGNINLVKIRRHHTFRCRADWQSLLSCGGGQLSCWGPHIIDHAMQFIKAPLKELWSNLKRVNSPGDADDQVKIIMVGENGVIVDVEISDAVALPEAYCTVYGNRGTLICPDELHTQLKYVDPEFEFPLISASPDLPPQVGGYGNEVNIPWIQKTVKVEPATSMWNQVEVEMARHLYQAIRGKTPFPVTNAEAFEVVRITEMVKKKNPQFNWKQ